MCPNSPRVVNVYRLTTGHTRVRKKTRVVILRSAQNCLTTSSFVFNEKVAHAHELVYTRAHAHMHAHVCISIVSIRVTTTCVDKHWRRYSVSCAIICQECRHWHLSHKNICLFVLCLTIFIDVSQIETLMNK